MTTYASVDDVEKRSSRPFSAQEIDLCTALLEDAAVIIDSRASSAGPDVKKIVSCRMVLRAMPSGDAGIPLGATQGSMSALGYSQSWTIGSGSAGELYLGKQDKQLLGLNNLIGSFSPVETLAGGGIECAALM